MMEKGLFKPIFENPEKFYTSESVLDKIEPFHFALYIVGVVKTFDSDRERVVNKATNQISTVFNFSLEGLDGISIHVCCWKENLHLLEGKIIGKNVLLIDGSFARPVKSSYSEDGRRFQLTIRPNTRVYLLRDMSPSKALLPEFEKAVYYDNIQDIVLLVNEEEKVPIAIDVWIKQGLRMRDANLAVCVVRDKDHFVKFLDTGFTPNMDTNPKVGDKIKIIAFASYSDNGTLLFEGQFDKIKKVEADDKFYLTLGAAASPGKKIKMEKNTQ